MNNCVFCKSSANLNTELTITLDDGSKVKVHICDEHAEDATVKTARVAYMELQNAINQVLEQARALGLNISVANSGLTIVQSNEQASNKVGTDEPKKSSTSKNAEVVVQELLNDRDLIPTEKLDSHRGMRSVGGSTEYGSVESHSSHGFSDLSDRLDDSVMKGVARMAVVEGREGSKIAIPTMRRDGTGTTTINIINTENDKTLQARFKNMSDRSMNNDLPNFAKQGYAKASRDCPMCRGQMVISGQTCPKCLGTGIISTY